MRLFSTIALLFALLPAAASVAADPCRSIVAATVAELRAGATAWDEGIEALARTAAGSACVKALSGASAEVSSDGPADVEVTNTEVPSLVAADTEALAAEPDDGKAGWQFLGFEVNAVSGSPGQKPYERKR